MTDHARVQEATEGAGRVAAGVTDEPTVVFGGFGWDGRGHAMTPDLIAHAADGMLDAIFETWVELEEPVGFDLGMALMTPTPGHFTEAVRGWAVPYDVRVKAWHGVGCES